MTQPLPPPPLDSSVPAPSPWRVWIGLTLAVAAVHGWLLLAAAPPSPKPLTSARLGTTDPHTFLTRAIGPAANTPSAPPPQATARPAQPRPRAAKPRVAQAAKPTPVQTAWPAAPEPDGGALDAALPAAPSGAHDALAAQPLPPARPAPTATLTYQVTGYSRGIAFATEATLRWERDIQRYQAEWTLDGPLGGPRWQRSTGAVTAHGLVPERFGERRQSEQAVHFDWAGERVVFSANTPQTALSAGAQDRLSVTLQLGALLAADPGRYAPGAQIVLPVATTRGLNLWRFVVQPDETVTAGAQTLQCAKLLRLPGGPYDITVELWLARDLQYLPARLRTTQFNGDASEQQLKAIARDGGA
ncbi:MAG: DUF3108 domain-containing protein [Burkholderiaceae bacterium]|jgi:hypothetical protein|nr:DUF3108 domain-containing protein [Burkholderiaceae bacterium]